MMPVGEFTIQSGHGLKICHIRRRNEAFWGWWTWFFPGAHMDRVFIALGRTIFIPQGEDHVSADVFAHEVVHLEQQKYSYIKAFFTFWRFWSSKEYRYTSELEAFKRQYLFMQTSNKYTLRQLFDYRTQLAGTLSSSLYGHIATFDEAFEEIGKK